MSGRRGGNRIRGPQSALTDFLAANNISAAQIREDYIRRQREAASATPQASDGNDAEDATADTDQADIVELVSTTKKKSKGKGKHEQAAKEKDKKKAKGKKRKSGSDNDNDDDDDDWQDLSRNMYKKAKKLPGQLEWCEICEKRFTVTPYSKTGPEGGLLCMKCGKDLAKDLKKDEKKPKVAQGPRKRRKVESDRLDGRLNYGAKSLQQLCIEKVVQHHKDIDELGDLPGDVLERLGEIFTKRRVLKPDTLGLFLRADLEGVVINDCAYLEKEDYEQIFAIASKAERLALSNACQFQDTSIEYMTEKAKALKHLKLYAANLVTDNAWRSFFLKRGKDLETLKLQWLDASFDDETAAVMAERCANLRRLKLYRCRLLGPAAVDAIATMQMLEHLSLHLSQPVPEEQLVNLISRVGSNLLTLSLTRFLDAEDTLLEAIRKHCGTLQKLRIADSDTISDAGFVSLFHQWMNPPLTHIEFNATRDIDNSNPDGPEDAPIGLADAGFKALMKHSGSKLERLNIASCRHISSSAFMSIFDGAKVYPELREIDLSFCSHVTTVVVAGIFKTCPNLKKLVCFGCFDVESVVVPQGILLIGAPRAQDAIEQFGNAGLNVDQAIGGMQRIIEVAA